MTTAALQPDTLSLRLAELKARLVANIPVRNQAATANLATKSFGEAIIRYLAWQARLIRPRPRQVVIWPEVTSSAHYPSYAADIAAIETGFRDGDDMNPYLSNQVRTYAYAADLPPPSTPLTNDEWVKRAWRGKDRMRVTVDSHHLHLGAKLSDGTVARSGELLFVGITPDTAFFLTIGDHESFDDGTVSGIMYDKLDAELAAQGGGIALGRPMVALGGTQVKDTLRAIEIGKQLREIDRDLTEAGHPDTSDRVIRIEWDDIVVRDPTTNEEIERISGKL